VKNMGKKKKKTLLDLQGGKKTASWGTGNGGREGGKWETGTRRRARMKKKRRNQDTPKGVYLGKKNNMEKGLQHIKEVKEGGYQRKKGMRRREKKGEKFLKAGGRSSEKKGNPKSAGAGKGNECSRALDRL